MADHQYLKDLFSNLTDEDILDKVRNGLTPDAYQIACGELKSRGIDPPPVTEEPMNSDEPPYPGDRVVLVRDLDPTEAYILTARLRAAGIDADPGDVNTVQGNSLWTIALGGAKVRVPQSQLEEARQILDAFRRGEFAINDDFDTGSEI